MNKKKRFYYRRVNPKWCLFNLPNPITKKRILCCTWANKQDKYCKDCDDNKENRK